MLNIYPKLKHVDIKGVRLDSSDLCFKCDSEVRSILENLGWNWSCGSKSENTFNILIKDLKEFRQICSFKKDACGAEAYGIYIEKGLITIYCKNKRALAYAISTVLRMVENDEMFECIIYDYPDMNIRGIIEGFYGKPWSIEDRMDAIEKIARHRMNTYVYAPKDDIYHRDKWFESYPMSFMENISKLFKKCCSCNVDFYYTVSPGLSIKYTSKEHLMALFDKYKQLYDIGVRNFGILYDDIPLALFDEEDRKKFKDAAEAHIYLTNELYEFFNKMDSSCRLIVCPTVYFGRGKEDYIVRMGLGIPEEVDMFWTGRSICSQELDSRDAEFFYRNTGHKPLYWDNYPVNDGGMSDEMHIGPIAGRDGDLYKFAAGLVSNVMEYKESSMIPVITIAHYLWNSEEYDRDLSMKNAVYEVVGEKDYENFSAFARYCAKSCINQAPVGDLSQKMIEFKYQMLHGNPLKAIMNIAAYFNQGLNTGIELKNTMENKKLLEEIEPWLDKYIDFNRLCLSAIEYMNSKLSGEGNMEELKLKMHSIMKEFENRHVEMMNVEARMLVNTLLNI